MKKRSLLVATAMLLVAVIVATSATYAWFTTANTASATVEMQVATGSSLQISLDGSEYKSALTSEEILAKMASPTSTIWSDFSTTTEEFEKTTPAFYSEEYDPNTGLISRYKADNTVSKVTIYFKSTSSHDVKLTSTLDFANASTTLRNATRIAVDSNKTTEAALHTFFANVAGDTTNTVDADGADAANKYTSVNFSNATAVVKMIDTGSNDGYFYGSATFYFFIEGTQADNGALANASTIEATLSFAQ